jgi:hypothetical protein
MQMPINAASASPAIVMPARRFTPTSGSGDPTRFQYMIQTSIIPASGNFPVHNANTRLQDVIGFPLRKLGLAWYFVGV